MTGIDDLMKELNKVPEEIRTKILVEEITKNDNLIKIIAEKVSVILRKDLLGRHSPQ